MHRGLLFAALLAVLALAVPTATAQETHGFHPYEDVAFTDLTSVNDAAPWAEEGYVAATTGGVVLWPGEGGRDVVTTIDGLPTNVVWRVDWLDEETLVVGTEKGVRVIDPSDGSVEALEAPEEARPALEGFIEEMIVTDEGGIWVLDRGGNLTHRSPEGTWETYPEIPKFRANDLTIADGRILAVSEAIDFGPEGIQNWSVYEWDGQSWAELHHTDDAPVEVAAFQGMDVVGTRRGGVQAFEDGEQVDLDQPEALASGTVLDLVPDGDRLWVTSTGGLFEYRASTGAWAHHFAEGIPSAVVNTVVPDPQRAEHPKIAMAATDGGLAIPDDEPDWVVHRSVNGPTENVFLTLEPREGNQMWAGGEGASIFFPTRDLWNHWDQSELGVNIHSERIYDIEHEPEMTWFATDYGVYKFNRTAEDWRIFLEEDPPKPPANTYYDVERDGGWMWMAHWASGLMRHEVGTNNTYKYQIHEGLISHGLTCVDRWHEFLAVCQNEAFQLFNLSQASGQNPIGFSYDRCNNYACNYTAPMNVTLDAQPDGPRIWVASAHAGLITLTRDEDKGVDVEHQFLPEDGMPSEEVRALAPAEDGVWAGTAGGLARVTVDGVQETWGPEDGLGEPVVHDIAVLRDVLYVATFEGLYRIDLDTRELLPLFEGSISLDEMEGHVTITFPSDGARLSGATNMTGKASIPGRAVEEVHVRIDEGDWEVANGTDEWRYRLPIDEMELGTHEAHVRVMANGTESANTTLRFEVIEPSEDGGDGAIDVQHAPPGRVVAGRTQLITVTVDAPDPWRVEMQARADGQSFEPQGRTAGDQVTFAVTVPEESLGGELVYRFLVRSGAGDRWVPQQGMYSVPIDIEHDRGLRLDLAQQRVTVEAGTMAAVDATIHNVGDAFENVTIAADGLRSSWISAKPDATVPLAPGDDLAAEAAIEVPEGATPGATTFTLSATTEDGRISDSRALTILVSENGATTAGGSDSPLTTPGVPASLAGLLAGLAAVLARRRRDAP